MSSSQTMFEFEPLPDETPTSYLPGGRTRLHDQQVPHLSMVRTVGQLGAGHNFKLTRGSVWDLRALQVALVALGVEPVRITEAFRDYRVQAQVRQAYELWVAAGRPEPHKPGWVSGMKTAYAARPGRSNHGWGGAIDIDVGALQMPGVKRGSDAALDLFWDLALQHGFTPIIGQPDVDMSECWHFDHLGPLVKVRNLFREVAKTQSAYRGQESGQVAAAGCALAGTRPPTEKGSPTVAYIQARLSLAGHFCGFIDGIWGPKTRAVLKALNIGGELTDKTKPEAVLPELYASGLAAEDLVAA